MPKGNILGNNALKSSKEISVDVLVEQTGESKNQIFRFIRLTELVITLLDKVDTKQLAFRYLSQTEQTEVASAMDKYETKSSVSLAQQLKKMKQSGELTVELIDTVLSENKKAPKPDKKVADSKSFFRRVIRHAK